MIVVVVVLAILVVALLATALLVGRARRHKSVGPTAEKALAEEVKTPTASAEVPAPAPAQAPAPAPAPAQAPPKTDYRSGLAKSRGGFSVLRGLRTKKALESGVFDELEATLLRADVGVATTASLLTDLRTRVEAHTINVGDELLDALRDDLLGIFEETDRSLRFDGEEGVIDVWLFVGVNGVGKTTSMGKVAKAEAGAGRSVLLAAGDTFRAAAGEQLAQWADRSGCDIVRGAEGGDPSALAFDAVQRASARGNDLVLVDTAGRLHTKVNLVEELKKIRRVADRAPGRVTEVLLVLDATTGQNAVVQAREFTESVGVTGIILTKLDGTARGGTVIAAERELGLPVKLVGLGEGPNDLMAFDPAAFVDALLGT